MHRGIVWDAFTGGKFEFAYKGTATARRIDVFRPIEEQKDSSCSGVG